MTEFIALIHKEPDSDYGVSFPDFPGCVSAGETLDEARSMAAEALALHVEGMLEDGETVPSPSSLESIMALAANRSAVAALVPLNLSERTVRVNISVPETLLGEIDFYVASHGLTRSGLLVDAATAFIRQQGEATGVAEPQRPFTRPRRATRKSNIQFPRK